MKHVGLVLALLVTSVSSSHAQTARLELETERRADAQLTLHAPMAIFAASMTAVAALGMSLSVLAISHCDTGSCETLNRRTNGVFAGTLAASGLALTSLIWLLSRSHKRRQARAALALSVFGGGLRF